MGSLKRREVRTLLSPSTRAQNRRRKCKVRAGLVLVLAEALGALVTDGDSAGVMGSQGPGVGATVLARISGPAITLKAASWPTSSMHEPMIWCGAVRSRIRSMGLASLRSKLIRLPRT